MDAIAQHGAQARPVEPLAQEVLTRPRLRARDVSPRHQVPAQECAQGKGIQPIGLNLRIGDQPGLKRVGQHHFFHFLNLFE